MAILIITRPVLIDCPILRYGDKCSKRCQCLNGASCSPVNGKCFCAPGWSGKQCQSGSNIMGDISVVQSSIRPM